MAEKKRRAYRKGMEFLHSETKEKIIFGKWNEAKTQAVCLTKSKSFITVSREDLDEKYISFSEMDRLARERRSGQGW